MLETFIFFGVMVALYVLIVMSRRYPVILAIIMDLLIAIAIGTHAQDKVPWLKGDIFTIIIVVAIIITVLSPLMQWYINKEA